MTALRMSKVTRYPSLDVLRAASMLFIVLWHAMLAYGPTTKGRWSVLDPQASDGWSTVIWLTMGVTLRIFFVMAGFFAHMVYQRLGVRSFALLRLKRVGIPLVGGAYVFNVVFKGRFEYYPFHLWFLQHILLFSLLTPVIVELGKALRSSAIARTSDALESRFRRVMSSVYAPLVAAVPTALFLLGGEGSGRDPATLANDPYLEPVKVGYYAVFFAFGWLLFRSQELLAVYRQRCVGFLATGCLLRLATFAMLESPELAFRTPLMVGATSVYTWLMVLGSIGVVQRIVQQDRPIQRYIADASYFFYFAHPILVIGLQMLLTRYQMPPVLKYALVVTATLSILAFLYEFLVRYTAFGSLLNGPRQRPEAGRSAAWAWRPAPAPKPAVERDRHEPASPVVAQSASFAHRAPPDPS